MRLPSRFGRFRKLHKALSAAALGVLVSGYSIISLDALGQSAFDGATYVVDWPENRPSAKPGVPAPPLDYTEYNLLPFVDTLAVHYRFSDSLGLPSMHFAIEWTAGEAGILHGRKVSTDQMPERVVIESIDLLIPVIARGGVVAELFLPLDTLGLGPVPSVTFVDISNARWDSVFVDTGAEDTRALFATGFRLGTPRILRVVFAVEETEPERYRADDRRYPPTAPPERTVCIPDIDIWISWRDGRRRWAPPPGAIGKATRDRRDEIGRTGLVDRTRVDRGYDRPPREATSEGEPEAGGDERTSGENDTEKDDKASSGRDRRTGRSGDGGIGDFIKPKNDDDDDDEDRLYPAALAGVAAVGGIAIFGGTVGYFGTYKAPIGLMSGYVQPDGGFLLQVAINRQVFGRASGPENLVAGVTAFYDAFRSPIQPAIGLGARFTEEGTEDVRHEPSVSVGLVGNFGPWLVLAAYDFTVTDFRFGVAFNLRQMN